MVEHGFIRDMLDVKCLILYVMKQVEFPLSLQKIYELCFQDDKLSYFDLSIAVPEMVQTGHLMQPEHDRYCITKLGIEAEESTNGSVAVPVKRRAKEAVEAYNAKCRRERVVETASSAQQGGGYMVRLELRDPIGSLMKLEVMAPDAQQAGEIEKTFRDRAETVYRAVMAELLKK